MKRDILYYETRIERLTSRDEQANRAIISKCRRKLKELKLKLKIDSLKLSTFDGEESFTREYLSIWEAEKNGSNS